MKRFCTCVMMSTQCCLHPDFTLVGGWVWGRSPWDSQQDLVSRTAEICPKSEASEPVALGSERETNSRVLIICE